MSLEIEALTLWALSGCAVILAVLTLRALLGQWLSSRARYALWLLVLARLLIFAQLPIAAPVTLAGLLPEALPVSQDPFPSLPDPVPAILGGSDSEPILELAPPAAAEDISVTVSPALTPGRAAVCLWAAGAAVSGGVLLAFNLRFARGLRRRRRPEAVPDCPLKVYRAEGLPSPCLFGLFRPAIYLTPEAAALGPREREHILVHELTHRAHGDHIWSFLRCLCLALHWYNPLVWLAAALSKRDGELSCDEGAVARLGEKERVPYGRTLVGLSIRGTRPADLLECSTAMTGGKKALRDRVAALVKKPETRKTALFTAAALLALAAVFTFAGPAGEDGEGDIYDSFQARAEAARTLTVGEPMYSSFHSPDIVDEDLVEEGRTILRQVERSPDAGAWAGADFPNIWAESRGLILDGTYRYALYDKDGTCYVLEPRTPERSDYIAGDYYIVGTLPQGMTAGALGSLGRRQYQRMSLQWQTEKLYEALDMPAYVRFTGPFVLEAHGDEGLPAISDPDLVERAAEALHGGELQDGSSVRAMGEDYWGAVTVRTTAGWQVFSYNVTNLEMCRALYGLALEQWERNQEVAVASDYEQYQARLSSAQAIWINMPMLHDSRVLTDLDLLEQAKTLLSLTPIPRGEPVEWDGLWSDIISFADTVPDADWAGGPEWYYLAGGDGDFYYVCSGSSQTGGCYLGTLPSENWEQVRTMLQQSLSLDDRQQETRSFPVGAVGAER